MPGEPSVDPAAADRVERTSKSSVRSRRRPGTPAASWTVETKFRLILVAVTVSVVGMVAVGIVGLGIATSQGDARVHSREQSESFIDLDQPFVHFTQIYALWAKCHQRKMPRPHRSRRPSSKAVRPRLSHWPEDRNGSRLARARTCRRADRDTRCLVQLSLSVSTVRAALARTWSGGTVTIGTGSSDPAQELGDPPYDRRCRRPPDAQFVAGPGGVRPHPVLAKASTPERRERGLEGTGGQSFLGSPPTRGEADQQVAHRGRRPVGEDPRRIEDEVARDGDVVARWRNRLAGQVLDRQGLPVAGQHVDPRTGELLGELDVRQIDIRQDVLDSPEHATSLVAHTDRTPVVVRQRCGHREQQSIVRPGDPGELRRHLHVELSRGEGP